MSLDSNSINAIKESALKAIGSASNLDALREVRVSHVGDRSPIAKANQSLAEIPLEQRAALGKLIGTARADINQSYDDQERKLKSEQIGRAHV